MKIVQEQILFDCLEQFEAGSSIEALQANIRMRPKRLPGF